jgi:hypothetical protein
MATLMNSKQRRQNDSSSEDERSVYFFSCAGAIWTRKIEWLVSRVETSDADRIRELVLVDQRTNTVVTHRDVGIGISQVLARSGHGLRLPRQTARHGTAGNPPPPGAAS